MKWAQVLKIACLLCATLLPLTVQAQFTFSTNTDGTLNITGFSGSGALTIPDTYNNLPITTIGYNAFNLSGLSSVTMGTNITSIGIYGFSSSSFMKSVTFGPRTTSIGNSAFSSCSALTNIVIPDSVTNFGVGVFSFCHKLKNATLGNGVPSLANNTFDSCTNLTNVVIGGSVASFGNSVFYQCPLKAITVAPQNQFFSSVDGVFFDKNKTMLMLYPYGKGGSGYSIPDSVTNIRSGAFYNCASFTNITIPDHVTDVGTSAFSGCPGLTSVSFGSSIVNLGTAAFQGDVGLRSVTLPDSVATIGQFAFYNCTNLTNVTIGRGITTIVGGAFLSCTALKGVYFRGNAPSSSESFAQDGNAIAYYLPGTLGWSPRFGDPYGLPTAPWVLPNPLILNFEPTFGVHTNNFNFIVSWATNISVVVETCTNVAGNAWQPLQTNTIAGGWFYFTDPEWTNYPNRFYRIRSQ